MFRQSIFINMYLKLIERELKGIKKTLSVFKNTMK